MSGLFDKRATALWYALPWDMRADWNGKRGDADLAAFDAALRESDLLLQKAIEALDQYWIKGAISRKQVLNLIGGE